MCSTICVNRGAQRSPHDPGKMITKRVMYTEGDWIERSEPDGTRSVFAVGG